LPETGVTISFALAGAACVLNALCYAELASRFPAVVGGAYLYTYAAFNELTAFLVFTQLMIDYHIGAASIARSLASYFIQFLELIPAVKGNVPSWIGHGEEFFGGVVSVNLLAPVLLVILTVILCRGVKESSTVNTFMTTLKVRLFISYLCKSSTTASNLLKVEMARSKIVVAQFCDVL
jgi:APA family basic amino acid/polyamine antiporter